MGIHRALHLTRHWQWTCLRATALFVLERVSVNGIHVALQHVLQLSTFHQVVTATYGGFKWIDQHLWIFGRRSLKRSKPACWLHENIDKCLTVFTTSQWHRRRLCTNNNVERAVNREIKRRTLSVRAYPSVESLLRLETAQAVNVDEKWIAELKAYIRMEDNHD